MPALHSKTDHRLKLHIYQLLQICLLIRRPCHRFSFNKRRGGGVRDDITFVALRNVMVAMEFESPHHQTISVICPIHGIARRCHRLRVGTLQHRILIRPSCDSSR